MSRDFSLFFLVLCWSLAISAFKILPSPRIVNSKLSSAVPSDAKVFASYVIFKGKGAVCVKAIPSTFSSSGTNSYVVSKEGGLLLEFAPATQQIREYDWTKKVTFLLDSTECGDLIHLGKTSASKSSQIDFLHDPNKGGAQEGQISKKLRIATMPENKGFYFNLAVNEKGSSAVSINVPVSNGEFSVVQEIMHYCIPKFLGFDKIWNNAKVSPDSIPSPPKAPDWKTFDENE